MAMITKSAELLKAQETGQPIVALESTIITHGMPFPQNLETARMVEDDIRAAGAVPATMAVLNGTLHAGLEPEQLEALAQAKDVAVPRLVPRDVERGGDDDRRPPRQHLGLCHGRHRWRTPRRGADLRHLR